MASQLQNAPKEDDSWTSLSKWCNAIDISSIFSAVDVYTVTIQPTMFRAPQRHCSFARRHRDAASGFQALNFVFTLRDIIPSAKPKSHVCFFPFFEPFSSITFLGLLPAPPPPSHATDLGKRRDSRAISLKGAPTRSQTRPMLVQLPFSLPGPQYRIFSRRFIYQVRHPCMPTRLKLCWVVFFLGIVHPACPY